MNWKNVESSVHYKVYTYKHWRRSALNSAGALQGGGGEFRGFALKTYSKHTKYAPKFRGGGEKAQVHVHLWHLLVRRHCELGYVIFKSPKGFGDF